MEGDSNFCVLLLKSYHYAGGLYKGRVNAAIDAALAGEGREGQKCLSSLAGLRLDFHLMLNHAAVLVDAENAHFRMCPVP